MNCWKAVVSSLALSWPLPLVSTPANSEASCDELLDAALVPLAVLEPDPLRAEESSLKDRLPSPLVSKLLISDAARLAAGDCDVEADDEALEVVEVSEVEASVVEDCDAAPCMWPPCPCPCIWPTPVDDVAGVAAALVAELAPVEPELCEAIRAESVALPNSDEALSSMVGDEAVVDGAAAEFAEELVACGPPWLFAAVEPAAARLMSCWSKLVELVD